MKKKRSMANALTLGSKKNAFELYILADRKPDVIHRWLNGLGVYPYMVTDNTELMLNALIFEQGRVLLIVVDSGAALFSSAGQFDYMKDLASIANKKNKKETVFLYTSEKLKTDIDYALDNHVSKWYPYNGTPSILECINRYHSYHIKGQPCMYTPTLSELLNKKLDVCVDVTPTYTPSEALNEALDLIKKEAKIYNGKDLKKEKLATYNAENFPIYNVEI